MKKMTKKLMRELLKEDNYIEALAFEANRVAKYSTYTAAKNQLEKDYKKMIDWAYEFEDEDFANNCDDDDMEYTDYSAIVGRIYTGVYFAIEEALC